uniref:Uncharacterized protein n=1 Tax=Ciona savignyi TaxID=51511 RepID=H2YLV5_CIOSA
SECIQDSLPKCITASCHLSKSAANCSGQVGCTWCHQSSDATRFLPNPYCTLTEDCYKGVEFARLPGYESREVCADPAADSIRLKTILACVGGSILLLLLLALAIYCFKQKRRKAKCENVDHEYDKVCPGSPSNDKTSESQEQTSKEKSSKSAPRVIISVVDS